MGYNFKKLAEVEALDNVPENATVLAEVDGAVKRVPGNGLGGGAAGAKIIDINVWYDYNDDEEYVPFCRFGELTSDFFTPYLNGEIPNVVARVSVAEDSDSDARVYYYCAVNSITAYRGAVGEITGFPYKVHMLVLIDFGSTYTIRATYTYNQKNAVFELTSSEINFAF